MGEGGPTYAARSLPQYNSAFAMRVLLSTYVCVKGEKAWGQIFKLLKSAKISKESIPPSYIVVRVKQEDKEFPKSIGQFCGIDAWGPEKFENLASGFLSLHTHVCTQKNPRCEGWNVLSFRPGSVGRPPSLNVLSSTSFIHEINTRLSATCAWWTVDRELLPVHDELLHVDGELLPVHGELLHVDVELLPVHD